MNVVNKKKSDTHRKLAKVLFFLTKGDTRDVFSSKITLGAKETLGTLGTLGVVGHKIHKTNLNGKNMFPFYFSIFCFFLLLFFSFY